MKSASCAADGVGSLEALHGQLTPLHFGPGWDRTTPALWKEPRENFLPAHWRFEDARSTLTAAGRLLDMRLAERRNLILVNPVEGNTYATTRTLVSAYQAIMPGEAARSHRHSPNAMRLMLQGGEDVFTIVDGQRLRMEAGDVLLTPNWRWHGHDNAGHEMAIWIDFLDVPLIQLLESMFLEPHADFLEEAREEVVESPLRFPWADTKRRLDEVGSQPGGRLGTSVELGDPAMSTMGVHALRLAPAIETQRYRTTANVILAVIEGEGRSMVDDVTIEWKPGDVVAVPAWRLQSHMSNGGAHLLRVSDEPVQKKLDLLRTMEVR